MGLVGAVRKAGYGKRNALSDKPDERELIGKILKESGGNISRAAELLGLSRPTLYKRIEKYGLK